METERPTEDLIRRMLSAVVGTFGGEDRVDDLVDAARAEAEAEVKELLKAAIKATLLQRAVSRLELTAPGTPAPDLAAPDFAIPDFDVSETPAAPESAVPDDAPRPADAAPASGPTACYVYGMVRAGQEGAVPGSLVGVDPRAPVRFIRQGSVAALVSDISLGEYGSDAIAERVKDLRWIEEKVRAHDRVVKHLLAAGAVVPCRFGMVLRGEEDLRALLDAHAEALSAALDALDGKQEWGVKVLGSARGNPAARDPAAPDSGKAYFLQKKRDELARAEAGRAAREAADACHRELSAAADGATLLATGNRGIAPAGGGGGGAAEVVTNAAYLVRAAVVDRFLAAVDSIAERYRPFGLTVEVTGPWPPYNFVSLDLSLNPDDPLASGGAPPDAGRIDVAPGDATRPEAAA